VLVVLVVAGDALRPLGAVKIYLLWCAVALAACAVAQQARRADRRGILATAAVAAVLTVSAGPFWTNGMILAADGQGRERGALLVIACNPVYATAGCLADDVKFVWNERRILYEFTVLGRDVPLATARWHVSLAVYAVLAVGLWVAACLRRATGPAGT